MSIHLATIFLNYTHCCLCSYVTTVISLTCLLQSFPHILVNSLHFLTSSCYSAYLVTMSLFFTLLYRSLAIKSFIREITCLHYCGKINSTVPYMAYLYPISFSTYQLIYNEFHTFPSSTPHHFHYISCAYKIM